MNRASSTQQRWSPDQIDSCASRTQRLYRKATSIVFEDFDHDHEAALIPAAVLVLAMVLDLHLSQRTDRTSGGQDER
jgi:hypothetical protein